MTVSIPEEDPNTVVRSTAETAMLLPMAFDRHRGAAGKDALTLLVAPRAPPTITARSDGEVTAFVASGGWTAALRDRRDADAASCFHALSLAMEGGIDIAVIDREAPMPPARSDAFVEAVVPHRGSAAHLRVALQGLERQSHPCRTILYVDQPIDAATRAVAASDVKVLELRPSPAGPYVPRQHAVMTSLARFLAFQDSDDLSLPSRVARLLALAEREDADLVGCHELRCDEITRRVEAIRYPLDVNAALTAASGHAQLFPTTLGRVATLRRLGGFSTVRTFGGDKQFHLRAYRDARMLNVDAFLYVRRLRAGSLTTAADTGMRSAVRQKLMGAWKQAFEAVKRGEIDIARSALRIERTEAAFRLYDAKSGMEEAAVLDAATTPIDRV